MRNQLVRYVFDHASEEAKELRAKAKAKSEEANEYNRMAQGLETLHHTAAELISQGAHVKAIAPRQPEQLELFPNVAVALPTQPLLLVAAASRRD